MSFVQIMKGEYKEAIKNARRAIAIQPGDSFAQFILGLDLIIAGRPEEAIPVLKEALRLDPLESRTPYLNVLAIAQYIAGHYENSVKTFQYNKDRDGPRGLHMDAFMAAGLASLGLEVEAIEVYAAAKKRAPDFPVEAWLERWIMDEDTLNKTLELLRSL